MNDKERRRLYILKIEELHKLRDSAAQELDSKISQRDMVLTEIGVLRKKRERLFGEIKSAEIEVERVEGLVARGKKEVIVLDERFGYLTTRISTLKENLVVKTASTKKKTEDLNFKIDFAQKDLERIKDNAREERDLLCQTTTLREDEEVKLNDIHDEHENALLTIRNAKRDKEEAIKQAKIANKKTTLLKFYFKRIQKYYKEMGKTLPKTPFE